MKKSDKRKLFKKGKKFLYCSYNPYDNTFLEVAYEVMAINGGNMLCKIITGKSNIEGGDLLIRPGKINRITVKDAMNDPSHYEELPENYELIYGPETKKMGQTDATEE